MVKVLHPDDTRDLSREALEQAYRQIYESIEVFDLHEEVESAYLSTAKDDSHYARMVAERAARILAHKLLDCGVLRFERLDVERWGLPAVRWSFRLPVVRKPEVRDTFTQQLLRERHRAMAEGARRAEQTALAAVELWGRDIGPSLLRRDALREIREAVAKLVKSWGEAA